MKGSLLTAQVAEGICMVLGHAARDDIWWGQWHCLHDGDEAGGAFAFSMLRPDSEKHVSWESLSAATAACMLLATGQEAPQECVAGIVRGCVYYITGAFSTCCTNERKCQTRGVQLNRKHCKGCGIARGAAGHDHSAIRLSNRMSFYRAGKQ